MSEPITFYRAIETEVRNAWTDLREASLGLDHHLTIRLEADGEWEIDVVRTILCVRSAIDRLEWVLGRLSVRIASEEA